MEEAAAQLTFVGNFHYFFFFCESLDVFNLDDGSFHLKIKLLFTDLMKSLNGTDLDKALMLTSHVIICIVKRSPILKVKVSFWFV